MPKKSKKSKSKRLPLRKKYKILKKVREHHKKKAKEAARQERRKPKAEKDPGIPAAWPFREQELAALEAKRAATLEEMERKKLEKKEARKRRLGEAMEADGEDTAAAEGGVAALVKDAEARDEQFQQRKKLKKGTVDGANEGSRRAYWKEFQKVIEASDVIIEVLDARDPLGSRCKEVERMVVRSGANKRVVLLLNKIDLIPREVAEQWLKYLREELPTVAFKCSTQSQKGNLGQSTLPAAAAGTDALQTRECLGADTLIQLLKNYSRNQEIKTSVTVGVIGFPNVGKSSLINSLKRAKVANVGSTPGVTKTLQEVHLDKHVKLLDCPGIVFAATTAAAGGIAAAALRNAVRVEKLEDPITPVGEILRLCGPELLMTIYNIARFKTADEFLQSVAAARGRLKKGGVPDTAAAARVVLQDWNAGKIPYYTQPPERAGNDGADAQLVAEWAKEFNVDEVFLHEESAVIAGLPALQQGVYAQLPPGAAPKVDLDGMQEDTPGDGNAEEEKEEDAGDDEDEEDGDDERSSGKEEMDEGEAVVRSKHEHAHRGTQFLRQNQQLYEAEGILNPNAARADRKSMKKSAGERKAVAIAQKEQEEDEDGSDYDFAVDFGDGEDAGKGHARGEDEGRKEEVDEDEGEEEDDEDEGEEDDEDDDSERMDE